MRGGGLYVVVSHLLSSHGVGGLAFPLTIGRVLCRCTISFCRLWSAKLCDAPPPRFW